MRLRCGLGAGARQLTLRLSDCKTDRQPDMCLVTAQGHCPGCHRPACGTGCISHLFQWAGHHREGCITLANVLCVFMHHGLRVARICHHRSSWGFVLHMACQCLSAMTRLSHQIWLQQNCCRAFLLHFRSGCWPTPILAVPALGPAASPHVTSPSYVCGFTRFAAGRPWLRAAHGLSIPHGGEGPAPLRGRRGPDAK
jgi:hypothetical protein